jgi:methionyl-tRNA synthetase
VNDRPHIGHAYTTILADCLARWSKLAGKDTFFLTGTDEHGRKVQQAAEKRGVSPQEHVDEMHRSFKDLWPELHIENDRFIRTTEADHKSVVQAALQQLWDAGLIYAKEYGGWYSVSEERFWTEKDLVDGNCPMSGKPVEWIEEKNYFFKMSLYRDPLLEHIEKNPDFIRPNHRKNEVLGFLRQPLEDLCISRPKSRLSWGIEIPFDTDYVTYVWFDALLNYLSGIGYHPDSSVAQAEWEEWWKSSTHLLGKDILTTHCVYWTTMLLALNVPLPKGLVAHGWWLIDGGKMSKSQGNAINPMSLKDRYGVEVFRYYLARDMSVGSDATFSEVGLVTRNNSELANDLGNLVNRTLNIVEKRLGGVVPAYSHPSPEQDDEVRTLISGLANTVRDYVDRAQVQQAVGACMEVVRRLNKYVNETVPFKVVKTDPERAGSLMHVVLWGLREVAYWLQPVMPNTMADLLKRVGSGETELEIGATVTKGSPLFPKYDPPTLEEETTPQADKASQKKGKEKQKQKEPAPTADGVITFDDFMKVQLRVGLVTGAEPVAGADKLLRLDVDLGTETRQIVAGIALFYSPEQMLNSRVVVVTNLKPRKIFGLESKGMLLAARAGDALFVVRPDGDAAPGADVS